MANDKYQGHTPGPWRTREVGDSRYPDLQVESGNGLDSRIIAPRIGGLGEAHRANARLIADAPALLARVERLEAALKNVITTLEPFDTPLIVTTLNIARAALAEKE